MQKNDENVEVVEDAVALGKEVEGEEEGMASAYSTESFVYLDDAGNPLPPEEETSRLMAAGLRGHPNPQHHNIHGSHPTNNDDGNHSGTVGRAASDVVLNAGAASASSATTGQQQQQYNEDPDVFERERLLAIKRLEEALLDDNDEDEGSEENVEAAAVARTAQPSSSGVAPTTTTTNVENDGDDDDGDEEEEEEVYFSREATPGEDEWILERILDRRAIKTNTAKGTSTDYKVFYDDFGEKKAGMMAAGRVEYLCKWRWYEEPTWESRELLEDDYFKEIKSFEENSAKNNKKGTSAVVKIAQKWTDIRPEDAVDMVVSNNKKKKTYETVMRGLEDGLEYGNTKAIAQLVDFNIVDQIGRVCQDGLYIYGYGTCTTNEKIGSFLKLYQKMQSTHRPIILYHGSQLSNLGSICRNGLRVPSGKSEVSNGSVHGVGVYAAFRPGDAACFSNADEYGCLRILCCVALVSPKDPDINMVDGYCVVFQQPKMILPVWALDLSDCSHLSGIDHRCFTYETIGKRLGRPAGFELRHYINVTPAPTVKLDSGKSKTLTKVRNKNILQINKLAEMEARQT